MRGGAVAPGQSRDPQVGSDIRDTQLELPTSRKDEHASRTLPSDATSHDAQAQSSSTVSRMREALPQRASRRIAGKEVERLEEESVVGQEAF